MLKYLNYQVTLGEIPGEITLCINITNCPHNCDGCHSPELRKNIGKILSVKVIDELIKNNDGISCICFMGGDHDDESINRFIMHIKEKYPYMKTALYSGAETTNDSIKKEYLNYYKIGPYRKELGGLKSPITNQKLFKVFKNLPRKDGITLLEWSIFYKNKIK